MELVSSDVLGNFGVSDQFRKTVVSYTFENIKNMYISFKKKEGVFGPTLSEWRPKN